MAGRRRERPANGCAAHFLRGREIALEQRRRELAVGHVVEAVARIVFREQRRNVDIESQDVANGVLIFDAAQSTEGIGPAWIRSRGGRAVEGGFEMAREYVIRRLVWARHARWWHH